MTPSRATDVKPSEESSAALSISREQLVLALNVGGGVGTWEWDIKADRVYADAPFAELFSVDPTAAAKGAPIVSFTCAIHQDDRARVTEAINQVLKTGGDYASEFRVLQSSGSVRWVHAKGRCHLNDAGEPIRFPGVVFDITNRILSEERTEARARLTALTGDVVEALAQISDLPNALQRCSEAVVQHLDAAFARIWTLSASEQTLELQASAGLYTHLDGPHARIPIGAFKIGLIAEQRKPHLSNDVPNDPHVSDQEWARQQGMIAFAGYPLIIEDRLVGVLALFARRILAEDILNALGSISTNIALGIERKHAELALKASEERYRFLAETMPQMVWTAKPDGGLDYVSQQASAYFGIPSPELLGNGWLTCVHPEDRGYVVDRWQHSLQTGEPYEIEFRLRQGKDGAWRWFLVRAHSMLSSAHTQKTEITAWVGTCTDIHEQKRGQEALAKANRELEEFAYVASHDLQEPLRMVNIYTQLLLKSLPASSQVITQYAGFVHQGVRRMEALIRDLLSFSRSVHSDSTGGIADLGIALKEAMAVMSTSIQEAGAEIHAEPLPLTRGDTLQMAHVFQNLISNSLKYRQSLPLRIQIKAERNHNKWVVSVSDNGIGFDPQYSERIFGLFKRLHKDEYPGTGLGLAICQRIVERYGGRMWAEGKLGQGATLFFALPSADETAATAGAEASPRRPL